jgi:hypothetical protein
MRGWAILHKKCCYRIIMILGVERTKTLILVPCVSRNILPYFRPTLVMLVLRYVCIVVFMLVKYLLPLTGITGASIN